MSRTKFDRARVAAKTASEVKTVQAKMRSEGIKVSAKEIRDAIAKHGHGRRKLYVALRLYAATKFLLYLSESESGFEVVSFQTFSGADTLLELLEKPVDTKVETVELDWFLKAEELQNLKAVLQAQLKDISVYRIGEVEITAFIIGRVPRAGYVGVRTKLIET